MCPVISPFDADIDVVASIYGEDDPLIDILGDCKFRKGPAGMSAIHIPEGCARS